MTKEAVRFFRDFWIWSRVTGLWVLVVALLLTIIACGFYISVAFAAHGDLDAALERCVVIRQEGPIYNATPEQVVRGIEFPCSLDYYQALAHYLREVKRREDEVCPRCFPNDWPRR
jgi:hypothetical protein